MKGEFFRRVSKTAVYVLAFLLPLFFLPFTANVLEFQKQALLLFLVLVSFLSFLTYVLISKKLEINLNFINVLVVILLLSVLISTIFSLSRYGSFWGLPLPIAQSFLSLLLLAVLYFIVTNLFKKEEIPLLLLVLFASGFLAALFFGVQLFSQFLLPFDFTRDISFNTIGSVNALAVYLAVLLVLLLPLLFSVKKLLRVLLGIAGLAFVAVLFLINFKTAWLVFSVGLACLLAFAAVSMGKKISPTFTVFIAVLLVAGLFFSFSRFSLPEQFPAVPLEISPTQKASFDVLKQVGAKSLFLGSGPGTFFYEWTKHKPPAINETIFWGVRFTRPSSEFFDRLTGTGLLGILAFFLLIGVCLWRVSGVILQKMEVKGKASGKALNGHDLFLLWGIFAGLVSLALSFFLYTSSILILFLFFLLFAFSAQLQEDKKKSWDLASSQKAALGTSFVFVFVLVLGFGLVILYGQKYWAEVRYFQGLSAWQRGEAELSSNHIARAADLNPKMDVYWRDLSQIYLFRLQEILARPALVQEEMRQQAESLIASAINSSSQATIADSNNVTNWNIRGFVYRNMIGILGGADNWALRSYENSAELEPLSPYIQTETGRTYLALSDFLSRQGKEAERTESLRLARQSFEKAIELKSDYAPAHFQIAMIHVREGEIPEAISSLEEAKQAAPFDTGLAFQLGLIYYNDDQLDQAKREFERAVSIDPNYSNAFYFLGLIADKQGNREQALSHFEKIQGLNPDNQEIKLILENLQEGKPALEGVAPSQPPIEEKPSEQLE